MGEESGYINRIGAVANLDAGKAVWQGRDGNEPGRCGKRIAGSSPERGNNCSGSDASSIYTGGDDVSIGLSRSLPKAGELNADVLHQISGVCISTKSCQS